MTPGLPAAAAARALADPSKIAADPAHLILLGVAVLAALGYWLYRRNRRGDYKDRDGR
jgi:LPXTG-motif cell wall-anchored protein